MLTVSVQVARPEREHSTAAQIMCARDAKMRAAKGTSIAKAQPRPVELVTSGLDAQDESSVTERKVTMGDIGKWCEHLIAGDVNGEVAVSSVLWNLSSGELLITQYDRRARLIRRYEWQPVSHELGGVQLMVSDWDDQEVSSRDVAVLPTPPGDRDALRDLLDGLNR